MAGTLEADLGLTILVGLLLSIPAVAVVILYATKISSKIDIPANPEYTIEELTAKYGKLPGALHSFSPILLPIVLIGISSVASLPALPFGDGVVYALLNFIGNPVIALMLGVFLSLTLIPASERGNTLKWVTQGVTDSAAILAITGAGGSFGAILKLLPIADATQGLLATGAGSMVASHANDSCFWVVSQFSDMKTGEAYRCQTGMTAVMGVTVVVILYVLSLFLF